jgi:hypothetical protein
MSMNITWTTYAKDSYYKELDYINTKWTLKEVENFIVLVEEFTKQLSLNSNIEKYYPKQDIYSIVLSKQTTVFYRRYPKQKTITLLLFWNNQKNPKALKRLLEKI